MEKKRLSRSSRQFNLVGELATIYKWVFYFIVPTIITFLGIEMMGHFDLVPIHKYLLIFILFTVSGIYVVITITKRDDFVLKGHYLLLSGVMVLNLIWYYQDPGPDFYLNFIVALSLIGMVLIEPKVTLIFYLISITALIIIGVINNSLDYLFFYLSACVGIIITLFNRWRFKLLKDLQNSRKTFQEIFDSSDVQKFVLNQDFKIIDMSLSAESYLKDNDVIEARNKKFQEVFIAETEDCIKSFKEAIIECMEEGEAKFYANCSILGCDEFVPKEFLLKKGRYFDEDVFLMDVRINKEHRELIEHKDNVSRILDNISSFVFNISFDANERFKHHVNFVSSRVKDVYNYSVDEYIALVKAEKVDKDRHPDDKERINQLFEELLLKGGTNSWRFRMKIRKNWRWIEEKLSIQKSGDGNATLFGMVKDVTDEVEAEQRLKDSENRYRQIFETTLAGVFKTNIDGTILDCNPAFAKVLGYSSKEEVLKLRAEDIYHDSHERQPYLEKLRKEGELNNFIAHLKHKEGHEVIVSNNVSILPDENGDSNIILGTMVDITEQHQYEKEILESRLSFKNIVDQSPSSILIFTNEKLAYVNPMGEDLFVNVLNSKESELHKVFPKAYHPLLKELMDEADNKISSYTEIDLGSKTEKKLYSISVSKTTYRSKISYLFILQDITLQTEYNIQKLRAEMAEETNISLQDEIKRHKETQKSLVESTSRIQALFETTSNLYIISIDRDYNLVSFNNRFTDLMKDYLGIDVKIGDNFMKVFPVEDYAYEKMSERFNKVFNGQPSNMISNFPSKMGEVYMESFVSPIIIEGEQVKEISLISHDITEQVLNRRRILESEENNKALLKAIPDMLFKVDSKGILIDYRASKEFLMNAFNRNFETENMTGQHIRDLLGSDSVSDEVMENIQKAIDQEELIKHNFYFTLDNGEKIHFENRYAKINDQEVVIISRDVTDTVEYEHKLVESVKEKEVLLKEVHHRVKNNLQVINSILNLQSSYVEDEATLQIIIESQNRIRSMSYIHESLYQTKDFSSINFDDYITNLVQNLVHSYEVFSEKTTLELDVANVELALDQAIPCGLILNELITNALKYAYPENATGKINIEVWEEGNKVAIRVQDFGVGLPVGFNIEESDSLGLSLVDTLIDQIDGELKLKTDSGTEFLIIFEKQEV